MPRVDLVNNLLSPRSRATGSSTEHEMCFTGHRQQSQQAIAQQFEKLRFDDNVPTLLMTNTYSEAIHSATSQSNGIDTLVIAGGNAFGNSVSNVESIKFDDSAHIVHINEISEEKYALASAQGY